MNRNARITTSLLAVGAIATAGVAFAAHSVGQDEDDDAIASLAQAKLSLVQAVDIAQTQTTGRATRAELGNENGAPIFEIQVAAADNKIIDVKVDAVLGKVLSSHADKGEHGEHGERGGEADHD